MNRVITRSTCDRCATVAECDGAHGDKGPTGWGSVTVQTYDTRTQHGWGERKTTHLCPACIADVTAKLGADHADR